MLVSKFALLMLVSTFVSLDVSGFELGKSKKHRMFGTKFPLTVVLLLTTSLVSVNVHGHLMIEEALQPEIAVADDSHFLASDIAAQEQDIYQVDRDSRHELGDMVFFSSKFN